MKKIFPILFIISLTIILPHTLRSQGILNRIKNKVNQRANNKVDKAIDKGLDDVEGKSKTKQETAEGEVTIKRARLEIVPVKGDSTNSVQIKLIDIGTGEEKPMPEIAVGIFVKREFNPLKIGEGPTDESGEASVDVPNNLPGDDKGNITLLA